MFTRAKMALTDEQMVDGLIRQCNILNFEGKYTLCYLTSTQKKQSLKIQNWLGLKRI